MNKINNKKTFDISALSSQRLALTGFAALWIVLHHAYKLDLSSVAGTSIISKIIFTAIGLIKPAGNVGVEIFLICSGLGLYYSFSKNGRLAGFYKKRAIKILPPLFIVSSIYYAFSNIGVREYFTSVSMIDFYLKGKTDFWYFAFLIVLYAIYPLIHKFVEKQKDIVVIGLIAVLILVGFVLVYILKFELGTRYYAILRVPSFIIGAWLGKKSVEKKTDKLTLDSCVCSCFSLLLCTCFRNAHSSHFVKLYKRSLSLLLYQHTLLRFTFYSDCGILL